jgi:two-component system, OmpR family, response regulator
MTERSATGDPERARAFRSNGSAHAMSAGRQPLGEANMNTGACVLLVEDDKEIGALISRYLASNDIDVTHVPNGAQMDAALSTRSFDLIILDLNLPGEDGLSICRRLRVDHNTPIVMVTARAEDVDKILGLEMGADDYLTKPFNPRELLARIRSILRRAASSEPVPSVRQVYRFSGWALDLAARDLTAPDGAKVALTGAEFDLLHALCEHPNRVLSRDQLIGLTHGPTEGPYERSIDTLISRLRQKIEDEAKNPRLIQTVRSEGYLFSTQVTRG